LLLGKAPGPWFGPYFARLLGEVDLGACRKVVPDGRGLFGLNLSFQRCVLQGSRPFDEKLGRKGSGLLGGDETTVVRSIIASGGTAIYNPDSVVGHMVGPDRVEWSYFKRAGFAMGQSFALAEPGTGVAQRVARVFQAVRGLCYAGTLLMRAWLGRKSAYERSMAAIQLRTRMGFLLERIRSLWRTR
jgi:hypothetical protein